MSDLIDRQAAADLLRMAIIDGWEPEYAEDKLNVIPPAQLDFFISEKIYKAYDDGYNAGYMQGEFDARNEAMPPAQPEILDKDIDAPSKSAPAIPLAWIDGYIQTCNIFDLRANVPASKVIKTMVKIWEQENPGGKKGGDNGKT